MNASVGRDSYRDRGLINRNVRSRDLTDRRDGRERDLARNSSDRRDSGKNTLGDLNAAHASATARAKASPNSTVGRIGTYETQMQIALAILDRRARNAAITAARAQLVQSANKPLTERDVARVDDMLGIRGASSRLGAERRDFDRREFDRRDRDVIRDLVGDRREHREGIGLGRGVGLGNLRVDPARLEARAVDLVVKANAQAAQNVALADRRL